MTATYASGEVPMVGDVVEYVGQFTANPFKDVSCTVTSISSYGEFVRCNGAGSGYYAKCFKLIRRKAAPAEWVPGPPPKGCLAAWYMVEGCKSPFFYGSHSATGWSHGINFHIPVDIGEPPALPPQPLPRRFRARHNGVACAGCQFTNDWVAIGGPNIYGIGREENAKNLTDIEYIDE